LEKEGYNSFNTTFTKDEEVDIGAIIGGVFLFIPFLWTMKYKPIHTYELIPNSENLKIADKTKIQNQINPKSKAERLRELKALLDEKVITQGEYENEKRKILEEDDKIK
jgi:hypothetical protein